MITWRLRIQIAPLAHRLADALGAVVMRHFRQALSVEDKDHIDGYSPVTVADRDAEAAIRALINEACLDHGILGEEHGHERPDARFTWVIDPIDGTKAFITGMLLTGVECRPLIVNDVNILACRSASNRRADQHL